MSADALAPSSPDNLRIGAVLFCCIRSNPHNPSQQLPPRQRGKDFTKYSHDFTAKIMRGERTNLQYIMYIHVSRGGNDRINCSADLPTATPQGLKLLTLFCSCARGTRKRWRWGTGFRMETSCGLSQTCASYLSSDSSSVSQQALSVSILARSSWPDSSCPGRCPDSSIMSAGIAAGTLLGPLLLELGVLPMVGLGSSGFMVLFTSSSTTIQYILLGMLKVDYAICLVFVSMIAAAIGNTVIYFFVKKYNKTWFVVAILCAMIGASTILLVSHMPPHLHSPLHVPLIIIIIIPRTFLSSSSLSSSLARSSLLSRAKSAESKNFRGNRRELRASTDRGSRG